MFAGVDDAAAGARLARAWPAASCSATCHASGRHRPPAASPSDSAPSASSAIDSSVWQRTHASESKNTSLAHVGQCSRSMRSSLAGGGRGQRTWQARCGQPVAPSGAGGATSSVCSWPVAVGRPGDDRVVAGRGVPRVAATAPTCRRSPRARARTRCQSPSSTCTSTLAMPRFGAQATPAIGCGPAARSAFDFGTSMRDCGLDRCLPRPAAGRPVAVDVVPGGQLDLGQPLRGRHVAVEPGHDEAGGVAVLGRERLTVHRVGDERGAPVEWPPTPGSRR